MSITWHPFLYIPIWLYLENEEEIEVTEEKTPPPSDSQQATASTSIFVDPNPTHLLTKASPGACNPFLVFLNYFYTL